MRGGTEEAAIILVWLQFLRAGFFLLLQIESDNVLAGSSHPFTLRHARVHPTTGSSFHPSHVQGANGFLCCRSDTVLSASVLPSATVQTFSLQRGIPAVSLALSSPPGQLTSAIPFPTAAGLFYILTSSTHHPNFPRLSPTRVGL